MWRLCFSRTRRLFDRYGEIETLTIVCDNQTRESRFVIKPPFVLWPVHCHPRPGPGVQATQLKHLWLGPPAPSSSLCPPLPLLCSGFGFVKMRTKDASNECAEKLNG